jgi:hypothetical protein
VEVDAVPVPVTEVGIGTLRVPIPDDDPLLIENALVASASVISDFEDTYLTELTSAVDRSLRSLRQMVVARLRATATVAEPIAASAGEFMNPWHDDRGRFAPKGTGRATAIRTWGTDRKVTIEPWVSGHKHSVTSSNGDVIVLHDHNNILSQTEGGEQAISDLLNGAADAHDLCPGMPPPKIMVKHVDGLIADMAALHDMQRVEWERLRNVGAFVTGNSPEGNQAPGWIFVNPDRIHSEQLYAQDDMPAMIALGPARYKVMHEYGHLRMTEGLDSVFAINDQFKYTSDSRRSGGMSKYGNTKPIEAHAEAFAEWAARGGNIERGPKGAFITDVDYVVTSYANAFGWGKDLEQVGALAAAAWSPAEMPLIIGDSPEGPIYLYADGRVEESLVASAAFANPWHDEIGRFAPKGYGRQIKVVGTPDEQQSGLRGRSDIDFRYQPDLDKRAVMLWQQEFPTHWAVKRIARNMMAGKEPFDGIDLDDGRIKDRFVGTSTVAPSAGDYTEADLRTDLVAAATWPLTQPAQHSPRLYRGLMMNETKFQSFFENRDIPLDLVSATPDRAEAALYSSPFGSASQAHDPVRVMLTIENADAVNLAPFTVGRMSDSREQLMLGRGRIVSREKDAHGIWQITIDAVEEQALAASIGPNDYDILAVLDQPFHPYDDMGALVASVETALVAAGPFDLPDFNVMTAEEWAAAFSVEAADIVGDVVVDAATGQALRPGLNVSDKVITDLIDKHIGRLKDLGPLVQGSLRDALALAVREQLSLDDVIREIQATGPLGETAARAIARTELTAATNGGMLTGWKRDGFPFKQWVSLHDDRVRHAHLEADKQVVPTEQEFEVGGWPAQYPGDPRLPVHLRINCRCYMDRIGEDGQTLNTRLVDSTRAQLYRLAQELNIPGRSKMRKEDLFQAIDRYRNGFGYTSLEEMNRAQLLIRARLAGIVGRHRMTKPELMIRLRDLSTGRNRDRWLIDAGHGTREELAAVQATLAADIAALHQGPIVGAGAPPTVEKIDTIRRKVCRRYGGAETSTALCVGCGARLHWSNSTRWEQITLLRINDKLTWSSKNAMPACLACAPKLATMTSERIASTFTTNTSWTSIIMDFANPWHDDIGRFAPKGTGTKYDAAKIKSRINEAFAAKATYQGFTAYESSALYDKLNKFGDQMGEFGSEFTRSDGFTYTATAINDLGRNPDHKGFIGTSPEGITGAISYSYTPGADGTGGEYHIHWLGSTGIVPGVGSQLTAQVMRNAAKNNAAVSLVVDENESAQQFWASMGFESPTGTPTMNASDVAQWVENVK